MSASMGRNPESRQAADGHKPTQGEGRPLSAHYGRSRRCSRDPKTDVRSSAAKVAKERFRALAGASDSSIVMGASASCSRPRPPEESALSVANAGAISACFNCSRL
jgi:hypothetical protein